MSRRFRRAIQLLILGILTTAIIVAMAMRGRRRILPEQEIAHQRQMVAHIRAFALTSPSEFRRFVMLDVDTVSASGFWSAVTNKTSRLVGKPLYEDLGKDLPFAQDALANLYRIKLSYKGCDSSLNGISERYEITLWSVGNNCRDDHGKRDDIVVGPFQAILYDEVQRK